MGTVLIFFEQVETYEFEREEEYLQQQYYNIQNIGAMRYEKCNIKVPFQMWGR